MGVLAEDLKRNGVGYLAVVKGFLLPNRASALFWIRLHQWCERYRLPTFLAYRMLLHGHGLEFAPRCIIGPGFYLPHPFGVIFAPGTVIGRNVSIYGMVRLLGAHGKAPVISDGIFIGDGVKVVGGVTIGSGCLVGAGSVVTKDQPAGMVVVGVPAKAIRPVGSQQPGDAV